ncbi:hypothetical protein Bca52824_016761 [Brassica carinata]|uniref:40S ribosomal protein S30 n=1 Tax=Brassica carinata TaxID=52824 RepID=A0A8X7W7N2_BRACI|nr:hypothetical protein Bca52824_016761 [Brassica carinata]
MGKVHGSLARAGKVRGQTPKVAKQDKKKKPRGRAHKRLQHNRRFVTAEDQTHQRSRHELFHLLIVDFLLFEGLVSLSTKSMDVVEPLFLINYI